MPRLFYVSDVRGEFNVSFSKGTAVAAPCMTNFKPKCFRKCRLKPLRELLLDETRFSDLSSSSVYQFESVSNFRSFVQAYNSLSSTIQDRHGVHVLGSTVLEAYSSPVIHVDQHGAFVAFESYGWPRGSFLRIRQSMDCCVSGSLSPTYTRCIHLDLCS